MRKDMANVVTEAPRGGHSNPSKKWGRRLTKAEYSLDDHGPSRAPISAHRQYGWHAPAASHVSGLSQVVLLELPQTVPAAR